MTEQEKQYTKGFNSGYLLSKHEPELFDQLLNSLNKDSEYIQGMKQGKHQHDREKLLEQIKQHQEINKGKGQEKGL